MTISAILAGIGKGALATVRAVAKASPAVAKFVSTKAAPIIGEKAALNLGKTAGLMTAMAISKGVDTVTDKTIKKIPGVGNFLDAIVDIGVDVANVKGLLK